METEKNFRQFLYFSITDNKTLSIFTRGQYLDCLEADIDHVSGLLLHSDAAIKIHLFDQHNYNPKILNRFDLEKALKNRKLLKKNLLKELKNGI